MRCGEDDGGDRGPDAKRGGNKSVRLRARENRAQIALVGEVLHRAIRPEQRLSLDSRVIAGAGHEGWTTGAAGDGSTEQTTNNARLDACIAISL